MECQDCKFWDDRPYWPEQTMRYCKNKNLRVRAACEDGDIWDSDQILTEPDFGCVQGESRSA
jgi:hypothetical protein